MEIFEVAECWGMTPAQVGALSCRKFADYQEYMFLRNERRLYAGDTEINDDDMSGARPYQGPKDRG